MHVREEEKEMIRVCVCDMHLSVFHMKGCVNECKHELGVLVNVP